MTKAWWWRRDRCQVTWGIHTMNVIKWPRYWPFVRGIHRWPVNSPLKGQWRGALMFPLTCAWINSWGNNPEAGDLRHHRAHYVMMCGKLGDSWFRYSGPQWDRVGEVFREPHEFCHLLYRHGLYKPYSFSLSWKTTCFEKPLNSMVDLYKCCSNCLSPVRWQDITKTNIDSFLLIGPYGQTRAKSEPKCNFQWNRISPEKVNQLYSYEWQFAPVLLTSIM